MERFSRKRALQLLGVGSAAAGGALLIPSTAGATATYTTVVDTLILGNAASSFGALSIDQNYDFIRVSISAASDQSSDQFLLMRYNSLSASDYSWAYNLNANGTNSTDANGSDTSCKVGILPSNSLPGTTVVEIGRYAESTVQHGYVSRSGGGYYSVDSFTGGGFLGGGAQAVSSLTFFVATGNIIAGSRVHVEAY